MKLMAQILAAGQVDWGDLAYAIVVVLFGLISGLVNLIKKWSEKQRRDSGDASPSETIFGEETPEEIFKEKFPLPRPPRPATNPQPPVTARPVTPATPHVPLPVPETTIRRTAASRPVDERVSAQEIPHRPLSRVALQALGKAEHIPAVRVVQVSKSREAGTDNLELSPLSDACPVGHSARMGGQSHFYLPELVTPEAFRKAVVLSEVLGVPVSVRDPFHLDRRF